MQNIKIVFYSVVLNHHQISVADALWDMTGHHYTFVELSDLKDSKGAASDYSARPYLLRIWESDAAYNKAMALAKTADVCVFSGIESLEFEKERMKAGLLSFDMGERWLKHGDGYGHIIPAIGNTCHYISFAALHSVQVTNTDLEHSKGNATNGGILQMWTVISIV